MKKTYLSFPMSLSAEATERRVTKSARDLIFIVWKKTLKLSRQNFIGNPERIHVYHLAKKVCPFVHSDYDKLTEQNFLSIYA